MRTCLLFILLFTSPFFAAGQLTEQATEPAGRNTYALIVGISQYGNGVPSLQYAHRDAQTFAAYLQSPAGGAVPAEHIHLLEDSAATTGAVLNELDWLVKTAAPNDLVYIYFSGHGDIENITVHKNGFLLCYNTPPNNYVLTALSVLHLNDIANTLSAQKQANVVLVTDACHSGNMLSAGQNRGPFLQGLAGRETMKKEIRIISCAPDELSQEGPAWGGGRSVFSYYLVNGLKGLADKSRDGNVTLEEINNYLSASLAVDAVLKNENLKQTPSVNGQPQFVVARVDAGSLTGVQAEDSAARLFAAPPVAADSPAEEPITNPQEFFFKLLKQYNLEQLTDSLALDEQPVAQIPFLMLSKIKEWHQADIKKDAKKAIDRRNDNLLFQGMLAITENEIQEFIENKIKTSAKLAALAALEEQLTASPKMLTRFSSKLAVAFDDRGQQVIDQYLVGDEAELERRRYYNGNRYGVYPKMFSIAIKLAPGNEFLVKMLQVKKHYFSGVAARIQIPLSEPAKQSVLLQTAFNEQKKALSLEENLACIYNEMGILLQAKKDYAAAEKNYLKASELSPAWAIPQANLAGLYALTGKPGKGFRAGTVADSLQPGLHNAVANLGVLYERAGNYLYAEEYYRKAIDINNRHYYPFERLGGLYNQIAEFELADSFYYEAAIRKKGFYFENSDMGMVLPPIPPANYRPIYCPVDTAKLLPTDLMGLFTWGVQEYNTAKYDNAVRILKRVVALDKKNPLVYHYLGKIYYDRQQWEAAGLMFGYASEHYLETGAFEQYADSVSRSGNYPYDHSCFENFFKMSHYEKLADFCFLGKLNEQRGHYAESEKAFRKLIEHSPFYEGGYLRTAQLLEKLGRYTEAEETIKSYSRHKEENGSYRKGYLAERTQMELNAFYRRMAERFPQEASWKYKLGLLLYSLAGKPAVVKYLDTILYFPYRGQEQFVDARLYYQLNNTPENSFADKNVTGTLENIPVLPIPYKGGTIKLPGTKEAVILAEGINNPRMDGITYLKRTAELTDDTATLADIYYKVADMFLWAGSRKQALPYYRKSLEWAPGNASTRSQVAVLGRALFQNKAAMKEMVYLYEQQQISFPIRLSLAECYMLNAQFEPARKVLNEAVSVHPYPLPVIDELYGRLALLSGNTQQALVLFKKITAQNKNDSMAMYQVARLYAQQGNKKQAFSWLKATMEKGFHYEFVLNSDPYLSGLRTSPEWKQLLVQHSFKSYLRNENSQ